MSKEFIKGIPDAGHSIVHKSVKDGQSSFRITKRTLQSLWTKVKKINNKGVIIIKIPANKTENFILKCHLTKEKRN